MKKKLLFTTAFLSLLLVACGRPSGESSEEFSSEDPASESVTSEESTSELSQIPVNQTTYAMFVGQTAQIETSVNDVTYQTGSQGIVSVSSTGLITALSEGSDIITLHKDGYLDTTISVEVASIDAIKGSYVGVNGDVTIDENELTIDGSTYQFETYGFVDDVLTITYSDEETSYNAYLEGDTEFVLRIDEVDGESLETFMPTIEQFTGIYSFVGDDDIYNTAFFIGNYFNEYYNAFDTGFYSYSMYTVRQDIYYIKSFKTVVDSEYVTAIEIFDYSDDYSYYKLITRQDGDQRVLYDYTYEYDVLFPDATFLNGYFLKDAFNAFGFGTLDTANKTVDLSDVTYAYSKLSDDNGNYFTLTSDTDSKEIRPTPYGFYLIEGGEVAEYVTDHLTFIEDITLSGNGYTFFYGLDWDIFDYSLKINGEAQSFEKVVYNHALSLKAGDLYITPFKEEVSALITSETSFFAVNVDLVNEAYVGTFFNKDKELVIDSTFAISYTEGSSTLINNEVASITYTPTKDYPSLSVGSYVFDVFDPYTGAFSLANGDEVTYLYNLKTFEDNVFGDYADKVTKTLTIDRTTFTLGSESSSYELVPHYNAFSFSYFLTVETDIVSDDTLIIIQNKYITFATNDGEYLITRSFIDSDVAASLVGKYAYEGKYGVERFELTSDGKFFADTLVGDELVKMEYQYFLTMSTFNNQVVPCIIFLTDTMSVYLYFVDNALVAMDTRYVREDIFQSSGIYVSEDTSDVVYINNGYVYFNDTKLSYEVTASTEDSITLTAGDKVITVTNDGTTKSMTVESGGVTSSYTLTAFDYDAVIGEYTVGTTTYTLSVKENPLTGVFAGYTCSDGFLTVSDYTFVIHNGNLAMHFKLGGTDVYFFVSDGVPTCETAGGLLPPPPPPPPPLAKD